MKTLPLKFPVELKNADGALVEKITELTLKRLNGAQARLVLNAQTKGNGDFMTALVGASAGIPPSTVDKLDAEDLMAAMEIASDFFGVSPPTSSR